MSTVLTRRALIGAGLAGFAAAPLAARAQAEASISADVLQGDAAILRRAFEALHPGLHRYNTPADIDRGFTALHRALSQPCTPARAHLAFARLTAQIRCGHTYLNPWNQIGASLDLNSGGRTRLPFHFRWIDGRMIVLHSPAHPALAPGAEVTSLGAMSPARLLSELTPLAPADGHNDAKRVRLMELRGEDEWELFDVYFPLLHPELTATGAIRLKVRGADGRTQVVEVGLLTRAERRAQVKPGVVVGDSAEPVWGLERLPGGAGWITMRSWALFNSRWDWKAALNHSLDELVADKAPALVLDLRGNGGGLDVGDVILSRLVDRDRPKTSFHRFTRYRKTPADLDPYLKTWDRSFRDWGDQAIGPDGDGFYRLTRFDDDAEGDVIRPQGARFQGKLIVIIDASNSSATFGFAETLKTQGLATLVGQTTGGSRRGINGGAFFFLRLPGSGLEIDVPLIATFPSSPQPDAGVEPDIAVRVTPADIARGFDPERAAALALVKA